MQDYKLERICVAFPSQERIVKVLDDISLSIRRGEWLTIIGRNGSGKSTLARVLAGLLPVSAGVIDLGWAGEETEDNRADSNARRGLEARAPIRMVMQNPESQLFGDTVEEDLLFSLELAGIDYSDREPILQSTLQTVGLLALRRHSVTDLSGGQKQLLAVAGCIAVGARLIVFDEPTSMLDPLAREQLLETVSMLHRRGVTIVWVTHVMEELAQADRVLALEQGRVVYDGDVRRFFYEVDDCGAIERDLMVRDDVRPDQARCDKADESEALEQSLTFCERLGFETPFAIQAVRELITRGVDLQELPLTWEALESELEVRLA